MSNISFSSGYGEYVSGEFVGGLGFEVKSNDRFIFLREFASNSDAFVDLNDDLFKFTQHNFVTGEELVYEYRTSNSNTPLKITPTVISGFSTTVLPRRLYAIKVDFSTIRVASTRENSLLPEPIYLDLSEFGTGRHTITSKEPNKNSIVTINNIIQDPIVSTSTTSIILQSINNTDGSVTIADPQNFVGGDLVQINNEILNILSVGVGTFNNIFFERGLLGTNATSHLANSVITKVKGNYNIVDSFIYFTSPPYGNFFDLESGLTNNSTFSGRVFLRSGKPGTNIGPYDTNFIIDDISPQFDGIKKSFQLKENDSNVVGISTDNAIVTINDVFQSPSRLEGNVLVGSYNLNENVGITSINFSGNSVFAKNDINLTELPRGGVIFSVGSTGGFGYQPTISAGGTAIVSAAGTIQSISIGYSGSGYRSGLQTVNVGVGYSSLGNPIIELIGNAVISNGGISTVIITNPGSGYTNTNPPNVYFDSPLPYSNLKLTNISGGIGTEASIDIVVGQGSSVIDFNLSNLGYAYKRGDILTVSTGGTTGIPTTGSPNFEDFKIFVDQIFNDDATIRTIGELVIFDPIESLFDDKRKTFPLRLNGKQTAILSKIGSDLEVQNSLLIFIDTILQVPEESYTIKGGSILTFKEAPRKGSKSTILFYGGTRNIDTEFREVIETVKIGDNLTIFDTTDRFSDQNARIVNEIVSVDVARTNVYNKQGISVTDEIRPVKWCPQRVDKFIAGSGSTISSFISKDRIIYEPLIFPSAYAISGIGSTANTIYVDNVRTFFDNFNESPVTNDIKIFSQNKQLQCLLTATVSAAGTVSSIEIIEPGYGYIDVPQISISPPVGLGTTALANATLNANGSVISVNILNGGVGYGTTSNPLVIVEEPRQKIEIAKDVSYQGDFGIISGIGTTTGSIIFDLHIPRTSYLRNPTINQVGAAISGASSISNGDYFFVNNTNIGENVTSLDLQDNIIGVSTQFIDNVYQVVSNTKKQKNVIGVGLTIVSEVIAKAVITSPITGIAGSAYYGEYSWGKILNVTKSGFGEFNAYSPGITTSAIIQRNNPLKYSNYSI
jgi:hypothetical protein